MDSSGLENRFKYHPANTDERQKAHSAVRHSLGGVADWMNDRLPEGREKGLVMIHLEEAMFWANAAIARQP